MKQKESEKLYTGKLAQEWIDWVETSDPQGTREKEIFAYIKKWLEKSKLKTVADIGCGQGAVSRLVSREVSYIGIDPSPDLIARANKNYRLCKKKFIVGSAYDIPLESSTIDGIFSVWVWSHLEDLRLASNEMFRVLKKKGRFLIITASPDTYEERKTFYKSYEIYGKKLVGTFDLGSTKVLSNTTLYLHTKKEMINAIVRAGFIIKFLGKLGRAEFSDKGLYIVVEGVKP